EWTFRPEPPDDDGGGFGVRYDFAVDPWLSPDGKLLATVETNRSNGAKVKQTFRLHEVATGKELHRWPLPLPTVYDLAFSRDGRFVLVGSGDSTQRVLEAATGKEVRRWKADPRDNISYGGFRLAMTPDGDSIVSTGPDGLARWDWRTGKKLQTYPSTWGPIAFLGGGKAIGVTGYVNSLYVLDIATGKDLCPLPRPGHHAAFSGDGRRIAWAERGEVVLADAVTGAEERRWPAHGSAVGPLVFAPDGKTVATAGVDKHIRLWDVGTGTQTRAMPHEWVSRLVFSADGKRLGSVSGWHEDVCVWDVATGERRHQWKGNRLTTLDGDLRVLAVADRAA
ncbi:MAG TPA: WD40 repeat domain-containing protein, partial [Mycobacteriales bacterium]|nr:WD40 repeat domain-containing protein [Mycobacteriales bacterium]